VTRVNAHRAVLDRKSNEQSNKLTGNNAAMVSTVPTSPADRRDVTPVKETKLFDWLTPHIARHEVLAAQITEAREIGMPDFLDLDAKRILEPLSGV
jgi:hypothetical protein